jgi:serine/threonine protein kinase
MPTSEALQLHLVRTQIVFPKPVEFNEENFFEELLRSNHPGSPCPSSQSLVAFVEGTIGPKLDQTIGTHLGSCPYCSELCERVLSFERTQIAPAAGECYEILEEVGRGGMGIVYRARHRETFEIVALKFIRPEIASDRQAFQRFENELSITRGINHKNVCRAYEFQRTCDSAYIIMEFVDGESLHARLKREHVLSLSEAIDLAAQICDGLIELHKHDIVHRDIKPENAILDSFGTVKLTDFGVARLIDPDSTVTAAAVGTPGYMAPEQIEGKTVVDHRADIYALGLVLYQMLTGQKAYEAANPFSLAFQQVHEAPVPPRVRQPSLPLDVEKIILKCLERDPCKRFQSACELKSALLDRVRAQGGLGAAR